MTPKGTKITVLTWCKDEEHILPFFLRHYAFADRIIVFDNGSRDMSRDILSADKRVEIRDWDSGGELRDDQLVKMKSMEYRKCGPGWNIIVDADEFVYHPTFLAFLDYCDQLGVTLPMTQGYDMVSKQVPADDGRSKLTQLIVNGTPNAEYSKLCVVRDSCFVTYHQGCHVIDDLQGNAVLTDKAYLKVLHYRYLSVELVMEKARRIKLSEENKRLQIGISQATPELMRQRWQVAWNGKRRVLP